MNILQNIGLTSLFSNKNVGMKSQYAENKQMRMTGLEFIQLYAISQIAKQEKFKEQLYFMEGNSSHTGLFFVKNFLTHELSEDDRKEIAKRNDEMRDALKKKIISSESVSDKTLGQSPLTRSRYFNIALEDASDVSNSTLSTMSSLSNTSNKECNSSLAGHDIKTGGRHWTRILDESRILGSEGKLPKPNPFCTEDNSLRITLEKLGMNSSSKYGSIGDQPSTQHADTLSSNDDELSNLLTLEAIYQQIMNYNTDVSSRDSSNRCSTPKC